MTKTRKSSGSADGVDPLELARAARAAAEEKKGEESVLLDVRGLRFSLAHIGWPWCDELIAVYGTTAVSDPDAPAGTARGAAGVTITAGRLIGLSRSAAVRYGTPIHAISNQHWQPAKNDRRCNRNSTCCNSASQICCSAVNDCSAAKNRRKQSSTNCLKRTAVTSMTRSIKK